MIQMNIVKVAMADLNVIRGAGVLKTLGLGSCVGLTLFDRIHRVTGMAHMMLPDSSIAREGELNLAKYADTAIPELIYRMESLGANVRCMEAKITGGAQMFALSMAASDMMRIGPRNVETSKAILAQYHISIIAEDTGGNYGRTIEIDGETGTLTVRSAHFGVKEL